MATDSRQGCGSHQIKPRPELWVLAARGCPDAGKRAEFLSDYDSDTAAAANGSRRSCPQAASILSPLRVRT